MVSLSAALASICAVIALAIPSRVGAASNVHTGYATGKQGSSCHIHQRRREVSLTSRRAATFRSGGKDNGHHQLDDPRSLDLPPLLQRHNEPDHSWRPHNHQGPHAHTNHYHHAPRSSSIRSRLRRGAALRYSRRPSVYVTGEHGDTFLVSGAPPGKQGDGTGTPSSRAGNRRQLDESDLALGRIDIMSSGSAKRLGSLAVDSTAVDWTSGQTVTKAFPLNVSTTNPTQFIMMPVDSDTAGSFNKRVALATEVFYAGTAAMVMYCATYDPDPGTTSAILMIPCTTQPARADDADDPCLGDENDVSNPHESQIFSYDPSTGKLEPISTISSFPDTGGGSDDPAACVQAGTRIRRDDASLATPSSISASKIPALNALQQGQNVTLVYVAGALEVPAASHSPDPSPSSNSSSSPPNTVNQRRGRRAPVVTTTIITTVLDSASGSRSSANLTVTQARDAVSISDSSTPTSTPSARSSLASSISASTPVPTRSKIPAGSDESFEIEVVGPAPSVSATLPGGSSSSASQTLDPQAEASSMTKKPVSRRFRSATVSAI